MNSSVLDFPPPATNSYIFDCIIDETWPRAGRWCLFAIVLIIADRIARTLLRNYNFGRFAKASGCLPVPIAANPFPLPWSVGRKYEVYKASVAGDLFEGHFQRKYAKHGNTHAIVSPVLGTQKGINTVEPENIKAVLATCFDDYKRPEFRSLAARPLLLPGLFTTDGPIWAHWRAMIKPQFTRRRFDQNVADSERHMELVFTALGKPKADGWTDDVDLLDHLYRLTMDTATQFLFGISAETQTAALVRAGKIPAEMYVKSLLDGFDDKFLEAASYVGHRIKLSKMYWVYDGLAFRRVCRELYVMVDAYITDIRERAAARTQEEKEDGMHSNMIEEMVAQGASQSDMVNQVMHLLVAGMDTSTGALGWTFSMLGAHPDIYQKLRKAVIEQFGTETNRREIFTLETLKSCEYLQWVIQETLRLFPAGPINVREAIRDTVLPVGGGPDGKGPVAVRKGARVQLGTYYTHRRKDLWGEDADEYRPERWRGRRKGWDFTPFSGGPQVCVGQGYSITQVSYAVARFVMHFDKMEPSPGSNNAKRSWMTVLMPGDGVKVRMHLAPDTTP
ncbi:cytochrome P450 [Annulohypoxylon maeteangense]|uniref:cytochrome P450 n=1 Tax=Annulohypoxylon maeteangense TaxID=1927788 RepID=UPI002008C5CE|nr:cytochrome P450 [Annulohypoxylon maeteangense]KAI0888404.1 cytochrome P450 [Annulohypoxylon maeteangense]